MAGVTWAERSPSDWLASNGRWYPQTSFPRGWNRTALPPAPDHGDSGSVLRRARDVVSSVSDRFEDFAETDDDSHEYDFGDLDGDTSQSAPSQPRTFGTSRTVQSSGIDRSFLPTQQRTSPGSAEATVVSQRRYSPRIESGPPPPAALPAEGGARPAAPGRIRDDGSPSPTPPPPPPERQAMPPAKRTITPTERQQAAPAGIEALGGDLGRMLGSAKRKLEQALEDAIESER